MIYVPSEWFVDVKNESKVYNLLNKETDVVMDNDDIYNELTKMGENVIADKYRQGLLIGYK